MSNAWTITGGLLLIIVAGVLNGSWNASFSPSANLAVGKSESTNKSSSGDVSSPVVHDLTYHHAFALFQFYAAMLNIPICIYWAGGLQRIRAILGETPPEAIVLVIVFSLVWGVGTLFFGIACKVAGVGMGTNVSMGIITIIGTFLPLITENTLISPFGGVVCIGLVICCLGLWFATKALAQRDLDERLFATQNTAAADEDKGVHNVTFPLHLKNDEGNEQNDNNINKEIESSFQSAERIITPNVNDALKTSRYLYLRRFTASFRKSTTRRNQENQQYTTFKKFCVCLLTGITAVQLQFAFIFGSPIVDLATGKVDGIVLPGATPIGGSAAIIWLLAISIGAPISILKGLWSSPVPLSSSLRAPWWRHLRLIGTTSIPWICHIHLYGLCATTLLPENIAASVGWPLLMMMTNLWAIVLSKILGEWAVASPETIKTFVHSLCVTIIGLVVLMCSVAVPT